MQEGTAYLVSLLATGFLLGLRHALDADHVVAVTTLLRRRADLKTLLGYGATWGLGHTATLLATGLFVLTFRRAIPDDVASLFEGTVGVMLIVLGLGVLVRPARPDEAARTGPEPASFSARGVGLRPFLVGSVHGLAGSAALMLLVLSTVPSAGAGVVYILVFGVGSILGMLLFSGALSFPLSFVVRHDVLYRCVQAAVGCVSIGLGLTIVAAHAPL